MKYYLGSPHPVPGKSWEKLSPGQKTGTLTRTAVMLLAMVAGLVVPVAAPAQSVHELKAAFIFNFARFVEWPPTVFPDSQAPLVIGVQKGDPIGPALQSLSGKTVQGRPLKVLIADRAEDFKSCQIVFLARPADRRVVKETLSKLPVLTITDEEEDFKSLGAVINFIIVDDHIRFEINQQAARRANLRLSSQLLKLARLVNS